MATITEQQAIETLKGMFEQTDTVVIREILRLTRGNMDLAVTQLLELQDTSTPAHVDQSLGLSDQFDHSAGGLPPAAAARRGPPPPYSSVDRSHHADHDHGQAAAAVLPSDFLSLGGGGGGGGGGGVPAAHGDPQLSADEEFARRLHEEELRAAAAEQHRAIRQSGGASPLPQGSRQSPQLGPSSYETSVELQDLEASTVVGETRAPPSAEPQRERSNSGIGAKLAALGSGIKNLFKKKPKPAERQHDARYTALPDAPDLLEAQDDEAEELSYDSGTRPQAVAAGGGGGVAAVAGSASPPRKSFMYHDDEDLSLEDPRHKPSTLSVSPQRPGRGAPPPPTNPAARGQRGLLDEDEEDDDLRLNTSVKF